MDTKQLIPIAITAVTSVIAKEVFSWFVAWIRRGTQTQTARETARTVFSKGNLLTFAAIAWFAFTGFALWFKLQETSPITRWVIVIVVITVLNFIFALALLFFNFTFRFADLKRRRSRHTVVISSATSDSQQA